jgi:TRAP-type C4-dicarboxylate transport system substrate-binding protein
LRIFLTALLAFLALPAAAADLLTPAPADLPTIHLKVAGGLGQTDQFKEFEEPFWTKQLAAASGGKITAEVSPYDQDGMSGAELLQFTRLGAITIGDVPLAQVASEDPEVAGIDLAGLNGDIDELRRSIAAYLPAMTRLYRERYNIDVLAVWTNPAQVLFCNREIHGLADLKGVKVRVASAAHGDFVRGLGGIDITTPYNALMDALRNHVADCAITGAISGYRIGLQKVTTDIDPVTVSWGPNILIVNHTDWEMLGEPARTFLRRQIDRLTDRIWASAEAISKEGIACVTDGPCPEGLPGRLKLVRVTEADRELERQVLSKSVLPRWAKLCGAACATQWNDTIGRLWGLAAPTSGS